MPVSEVYGLLGSFEGADALVEAARGMRAAGYARMEAFAPYPLPDAVEALGYRRNGVSPIFFLGGLVGGCAGFFMLYWTQAVDFKIDVGGRPFNSWPVFIPITFELTILSSAIIGLLGTFLLCRLPRFHHPLFNSDRFVVRSADGFFLCVQSDDPLYDPSGTRDALAAHGAASIEEVAS